MEIEIYSDSEDEMLQDYLEIEERITRVIPDRSDPFNYYDDLAFRQRYRLPKGVVLSLLQKVENGLTVLRNSQKPVNPMNQLLLTLRFYSTGSFQIVTGDLIGAHKSTVCKVVNRVTKEIAGLYSDFVRFPTSRADTERVKNEFYSVAGFPGVLGALDCTHVAIQSPGGENAELFRNRKGYFSLNVQAVCSPSMEMTSVVARWPGSSHDSTIFNQSHLCARFETGQVQGGHLVGDAGYQCRSYLLTPVTNPSNPAERKYNFAHIATRNVIERTFGVLKRRFPCLKTGLRVKLDRAQRVILACCVLHNMCVKARDVTAPDHDGQIVGQAYPDVNPVPAPAGTLTGNTAVRRVIIAQHFS